MVICAVIGCHNRSGRDPVSFHKFPKLTDYQGQVDCELRINRLVGFLAAISREDIDLSALDDYRVCSSKHLSLHLIIIWMPMIKMQ